MNSLIVSDKTNKIYISFINSQNIIESKSFANYSSELIDFINAIPDAAFTVIMSNIDETPSIEFANAIKRIFGSLPKSFGNNAWIAVGKSGMARFALDNNCSSLISFLPNKFGKNYSIEIPLKENRKRHLFLSEYNSLEPASAELVNEFELRSSVNSAEYLIIYHPNFKSAADSLAEYRKKKNNVSVKAISVEDIYNDFNYGVKSADGIKAFLKYAYNNWSAPKIKYIVLMGGACYDTRSLAKNTQNIDYIPTFGRPASDYWYGAVNDTLLSEFIVARMPFRDSIEALGYFNKIKEYESRANR